MIDLLGITKTYTTGAQSLQVLKGVDLAVGTGELVAIMGSSGSGKSTLLNILGLLDGYDEGGYLLDGKNMGQLTERRAAELRREMLGFVFQSFNPLGSSPPRRMWPCRCITKKCRAKCASGGPMNCSSGWVCWNGPTTFLLK